MEGKNKVDTVLELGGISTKEFARRFTNDVIKATMEDVPDIAGCYEIDAANNAVLFYFREEGEPGVTPLRIVVFFDTMIRLADDVKYDCGDAYKAVIEDKARIIRDMFGDYEARPASLSAPIPRKDRKQLRREFIVEFINYHIEKSCPIPVELVEEYNELCERSESRRGLTSHGQGDDAKVEPY